MTFYPQWDLHEQFLFAQRPMLSDKAWRPRGEGDVEGRWKEDFGESFRAPPVMRTGSA